MSQRIDQLFKEKLSEHSIPPAEAAWERVQASANGKKKIVIIWRIAAAVLLMGLLISAWLFTGSQKEESTPQLAKDANKAETESALPNENVTTPLIENKTEQIASKIQKEKATIKKQTPVVDQQLVNLQEQKQENETFENVINEQIAMAEVETIQMHTEEKPTVIEFTLPTLIETKETIAVAAVEEEKSSGLKKFFETARDVKNGDAQFNTNLRDMKNELLAFDFKKDKTKRN